ncbi:Hypothetical predicted protein [Olea europaea subsp. europaea]|uniref:Uncharacterized protein n=1 Tax=Olea europaea subsp. europaea TaxID=158383 RepID=A0A8S0QIT3_OLEEU|nr:Hypothetical predicted protein [Olea europaea subsp. europaea]
MEFDYCIPEEARLRAHISQRSNLKYVKTVMDLFDDRQRDEFRNSPFGYLAEVAEIQFSAQLTQQLVFRTIRTDKGFWAKKFLKAKRRQEKEVTYTIHGFPIAMQVWAYEAVPEIGKCFGQRIGERMPRLFRWSARKQPQHRTYDAFFKNVWQYFSTFVPYDDPPVPVLDEIARNVVGPQFNASHGGSGSGGQLVSGGSGEDETFGDEGADTEESGEGTSERSSVDADTCRG